ncbi:MAG: CopG family antitoxin [Pseudomonadota bacterium]
MQKSKLKDSGLHTYGELGKYWSRQDLGKIWDETEPAEFDVDIQSERKYYPVELELSKRILETARKRGVSSETLVNLWLREKMDQASIGN